MEIGITSKYVWYQVESVENGRKQNRFCFSSSFRALTVMFVDSNFDVFRFFVTLAFESLKSLDFDWGNPLESLWKLIVIINIWSVMCTELTIH